MKRKRLNYAVLAKIVLYEYTFEMFRMGKISVCMLNNVIQFLKRNYWWKELDDKADMLDENEGKNDCVKKKREETYFFSLSLS